MFQQQKHPAGWPDGVQHESPPKPDLVLRNRYEDKEDKVQECEYLELGQRHAFMEPTSKEDLEAETKIPIAEIPTEQPEPETENAYEPIKGMEELE